MTDDVEPPPILRNIQDELRDYLICPDKLPIHEYQRNQEYWPRKPDISSLFHYDGSPLATTLKVQRDLNTGEIIEFVEVPVEGAGANAKNSTSMNRAPASPSEATRGGALNYPFWPGGFPDPVSELTQNVDISTKGLLTIPPGFKRGLNFEADGVTIKENYDGEDNIDFVMNETESIVNLLDLVKQEQNLFNMWETSGKNAADVNDEVKSVTLPEEDEIIPNEIPVLKITESSHIIKRNTDWAVSVDSNAPVNDFNERIPTMAHQYSFELDTFQKQAILQLEQHNHVFVAAHTSAGKTVVAEYAIALSQKHMTRTIYTSPIKALSNQKYRDFRRIFKDVGLITGDFQINQTASCLIMTTEILRTMLYCGSDVTRDLEYVIFDEVHYINDKERGHVWEQVMIMLPRHVCVVLLSATVPNAQEFADWLGRTHQKKVYVISTSQRPVPLQHYLYTGSGGSSKDNRFLVLNNNGWIQRGYTAASDSLPSHQLPIRNYTPKQEKTVWYALIDHLKRKELLPVVAFTFSRVKCDMNADNLRSLDLTTQREKSQIHKFFEDCVKSLKEPDREIPQILRMRDILKRGIGVHHSGVLPIIKEMVEMLFQNSLVKLLFATETFAMGVNMPARTVVFDSITKHDGREKRNLLPAEYIQMAGRAGRRGLDKEGTVIILCKQKIPSAMELGAMMMGKPNQLTSQFRLTYGMVLSLLRVPNLTVEDMMSRSFREAGQQRTMGTTQRKLKEVEEKLKQESSRELSEYLQPLVTFYNRASVYLHAREELLPDIMLSHRISKELTPGKVLVITHSHHVNKLAILLSTTVKCKKAAYKVLVLTDDRSECNVKVKNPNWYKMLALSKIRVFSPIGAPGHAVLSVDPVDVFEICSRNVKIDPELIVNDWDKRQIPRFKDDPPGRSCNNAIKELLQLTLSVLNDDNSEPKLQYYDFIHDLKVDDARLHANVETLNDLKEKLLDQIGVAHVPNFDEQFLSVFNRKSLEDECDRLKYSLSDLSLSLYPDYESRINLLRELKYVNDQNEVQLKGQVACGMGMNELMITELVLRNVLTKLQPPEVAALLSCLVFQAQTKKNWKDFALTNELKTGISAIESVHTEILRLEEKYQITHDIGRDEELHFGLVEVVYKWASDKPFAEIMELTDVQEGIIVRCIQQLNETICDVKNAARIIGDPELQNKMEEASVAIKRDIVFAASLYTRREVAL